MKKFIVALFGMTIVSCGYANIIQRPFQKYPGIIEYGKRNGRIMAYNQARSICRNKQMVVLGDNLSNSSLIPLYNAYTKQTIYVNANSYQLKFVCVPVSIKTKAP